MSESELVPRKTLVKYGSQGIGGLVGGGVMFALTSLNPVASLIVGGIVGLVGLVLSRSKDDRTAGIVVLAAGVATAVTAIPISFISGIAGTLLAISGITLLAVGGINIYKFIRGYRNRS